MEDLDGWILEENKVVTYKYLSRALDVHVNTAKQMLWTYKESKQGACKGVVYFVSGLVKGSEEKVAETKVTLVKEEKLQETLSSLEKVFSQHVYSIQLSETVHASALYAVDLEVFKENPIECCKVNHFLETIAIHENLLKQFSLPFLMTCCSMWQ